MTRRTPEQVHDEDGHDTPVASCARCQSEAEADRNADEARAELAAAAEQDAAKLAGDEQPAADGGQPEPDEEIAVVEDAHSPFVGETEPETYAGVRVAGREGPLPEVDPASYADDAVPLDATLSDLDPASELAADGRPRCRYKRCPLPEFTDDIGLCGGHWSTRPDLRKAARRD